MRSLFSVPEDVGDLDLTKVYSHKKDASMGVFFCASALAEAEQGLESAAETGGFCAVLCYDVAAVRHIVIQIGFRRPARGCVVPALGIVCVEVKACAVVRRESGDDLDAAVRADICRGGNEFAAFGTEHRGLSF